MTATTRPARIRIGLTLLTLALIASVLGATHAAQQELTGGHGIDLGLLHLRLTYNPGVAFSLGAGLPAWIVLILTGLVTAGVAVYAWRNAPSTPLPGRIGLAAVLAGAASNLLDRVSDGVVTDYFHTGWFPTFNLADTLITLGAALLILTTMRRPAAASPTRKRTADRP